MAATIFPASSSATYTVTAEATGFKKLTPNVRVEVEQRVQQDLTLELGAVTEQIEVTAAPPTLQTADSQMGGVVESKAISDLPLNGRNFTQLMVLMAGATESSQGSTTQGHYNERAGGVSFSVNGQRSDYNEFLIDGFDAKEVQHGTNTIEPIIDALQEFRVQTSNYSPEFGGQAGGQINTVMKSGTNGFHGTLWEFIRNNDLDANNFFNNLHRRADRRLSSQSVRRRGGRSGDFAEVQRTQSHVHLWRLRRNAHRKGNHAAHDRSHACAARGQLRLAGGDRPANRRAVPEQYDSGEPDQSDH